MDRSSIITGIKNNHINKFVNETTDEDIDFLYFDFKEIQLVTFENCVFNGKLNFDRINNSQLRIYFENCTFNDEVNFYNCSISILSFSNVKKIKALSVISNLSIENTKLEIGYFIFKNDYNNLLNEFETNFYFSNIHFKRKFEITQTNQVKGVFVFNDNHVGDSSKIDDSSMFYSCNFNNVNFNNNKFFHHVRFNNSKFSFDKDGLKDSKSHFHELKFWKNTFFKLDFSNVALNEKLVFDDCDFESTVWMEDIKINPNSYLKIVSCRFEKYVLFDNSSLNKFEILHTHFERKVSFNRLNVNDFKIHQVSFNKAAYFDELNDKSNEKILTWDIKTIRAIKRELVNTHNQIDYLRFKGYELNAYKKEKGKNWKDSFILFFNQESNYFGLDWYKGLKFTLLTSFICYLLYLITFAIVLKSTKYLPNSIEEFFVNFLKFLNPFSFLKSPIIESEDYFFPFLFFIIGKTFVSYGIYQTVQAFRKFGLNGG